MQNQKPTKGFLIVASAERNFYLYAINLMESIRDYFPEAQIAFGVSPYLCDGRESVANHVFHVGDRQREKLIALSKTPFDITMYIDADSEVHHEDITKAFDQIQETKQDMVFCALTEEREYCFAARKFPAGELKICGANFVYDMRNPLVREFMQEWKDLYWAQFYENSWWPLNEEGQHDLVNYPEIYKQWDQFSLWWLTNKVDKYKKLKYSIFEDDARWNWYALYIESKVAIKDLPIITHHSFGIDKYEKSYGNIG